MWAKDCIEEEQWVYWNVYWKNVVFVLQYKVLMVILFFLFRTACSDVQSSISNHPNFGRNRIKPNWVYPGWQLNWAKRVREIEKHTGEGLD